jgi:phosphatidylglycerophosphate synthase
MTAVGVLGAVGAGVAYALSATNAVWLWAASAFLVVNWFGDSLDGTLARVRKAERPRYGYYLDHLVDAFATAVIGAGIGFSPFVELELALLLVVLYLALSINIYLESAVFGVFNLGYGRLGPTEARGILILANAALVLSGTVATVVVNAGAALLAAGMVAVLAARFVRNLARLAKLEPEQSAIRN